MSEAPKLVFFPPEQLWEAWPKIVDRLSAIAESCGERWTAKDVFDALQQPSAFLWGTEDLAGFIIVELPVLPHGRELHCWIVANGSDAPPAAYWPQLLEMAAEHDCCRITFENDRAGFQRHIPGLRLRYKYVFEL